MIENPVKTVADTMSDFYEAYPQPPVLPLFRTMLMDLLSQTHLLVQDPRFKYNAVWAFGLKASFTALMNPYDGLTSAGESDKIWKALVGALGLDVEQIDEDAKAAEEFAKATPPAQVLQMLEGEAADGKMAEALRGISSSLYSRSVGIGIFKIMEMGGTELKKENLEEWMKALGLPATKANKDFDNYMALQSKLKQQLEMIREVQIREKKQLAERLEEKARALAAKAEAAAKEKEVATA
jgi:photosystem II biogenesis protein Psp29